MNTVGTQLQAGIFLDRDGVIIQDVHRLTRVDQVDIIAGVPQAIAKLIAAGFKVIMVTNQSVVARGLCTTEDVEKVNAEIQAAIREEGGDLHAMYYCPHHPKFDRESDCRKPAPGMLLRGIEAFELNPANCWMVGDKTSDILAGERAGVKTALVQTGYAGREEGGYDVTPDLIAADLSAAVTDILKVN